MKIGLLIWLLFIHMGCSDPAMVYVCDSRNALRYHLKEHCRGLSNCTDRVIKVSLAEARKQGKTLCHWEQ